MKNKIVVLIALAICFLTFNGHATDIKISSEGDFNKERDLLLVQFDCKTDVDDLHTAAALATILSDTLYSKINFHAVAGTYGIQKGLYVPPNDLMKLAFGNNWTDAHENFKNAIKNVNVIVKKTLLNNGDIWIAEAGQSDFTAALIKVIQADMPNVDISKRFHVVQHSDWNEKTTTPEELLFVKNNTDYQKIPDGNAVGNGTPGFHDAEFKNWESKISDPKLLAIWQLAIKTSNKYNGQEGRYKNEAIFDGGLDFSDLSEVCWILGLKDLKDTEEFFNDYAK
ncbi:hypothetical protein JBL43_04855 [Aureibaculum sp. A20]|uniref:DUF1593 domain-containing protein n=1 Tax=Aureibaculum flavum TaxID=2795986 RepID=A0ABS0WNN1_9FLAO|nr:hypothetical protein [Aureibaculum flavum]MBJ2173554.1 hypothetical protein [Aureibaculum flavum]